MTELPYQVPEQVLELLRSAGSILLATHENPDPDGLGSVAGFGLALPSLGYRVARLGTAPSAIAGRGNRVGGFLLQRLLSRRRAIEMMGSATRAMYAGRK